MNKKQQELTRKQEDQALNRGLIWVAAAAVMEAMLLFVNRYYLNFRGGGFEAHLAGTIYTVLRFLVPLGLVGGVACLAWTALGWKQKGGMRLSAALAALFGMLALCARVVLRFGETGMGMLYLLVPACAGLALVYYLYQREFFLAAAAGGLGTVGLWFVRYGGLCPEALVALAGVALVAALALWMKQNKVALASCVVNGAALAAGLALGAGAAYYLIFAMMAWLFALLVYYTVKMM